MPNQTKASKRLRWPIQLSAEKCTIGPAVDMDRCPAFKPSTWTVGHRSLRDIVRSEMHPKVVQRAVLPNHLKHPPATNSPASSLRNPSCYRSSSRFRTKRRFPNSDSSQAIATFHLCWCKPRTHLPEGIEDDQAERPRTIMNSNTRSSLERNLRESEARVHRLAAGLPASPVECKIAVTKQRLEAANTLIGMSAHESRRDANNIAEISRRQQEEMFADLDDIVKTA